MLLKEHFFYIQTVHDIERLVNEYLPVDVTPPCPLEVDSSELCCSLDDDDECDRKAELIFKIVKSIFRNK